MISRIRTTINPDRVGFFKLAPVIDPELSDTSIVVVLT